MRASVRALASLLAVIVVNLPHVALAHDAVNFMQPSFRVGEDDGRATVLIERGTHGQGPASVDMVIESGSATAGSDFSGATKTIAFGSPVEQAETFVQVVNDAEEEQAVETATLSLASPTNGMVVAFPGTATLSIVDDDGPSRVGPERSDQAVFESRPSVEVWVVRAGDDSAPATVDYSTADGSADARTDYVSKQGTLSFSTGERFKRITVALIDDQTATGDVSFEIRFSNATGAELFAPSIPITIRDDEASMEADQVAPYTAFHQPLHRKRYRPRDIRDFLVFMQDDAEGSGMAKVEIALRKKLASGKCAWWTGSRFRRGPCSSVRWSTEKGDYFTDMALFSVARLKPTTRASGIRSYTAYSRGTDRVGNVQTLLDKGQNKNTFKVRG